QKSRQPIAAEAREKLLSSNTTYREETRGRVWPQTDSEEAYVLAADRAYAKATGTPSYEQRLEAYKAPYEQALSDYNLGTLESIQFVIAPHVDIGIVFNFAVGSLAVYGIVLGGWSSNNKYSMLGALRSSAQLISYEIPLAMSVLGVMLVTGSLNLESIIDHQIQHGWNAIFQPLAALLFITSVFAACNPLPFSFPHPQQQFVHA